MIDVEFRAGRWLRYPLLFNLFSQLNVKEKEQLTDYIIQCYFYFDRETCYDLFKGVDGMISAIDLTQGKEFDVGKHSIRTVTSHIGRCVLLPGNMAF